MSTEIVHCVVVPYTYIKPRIRLEAHGWMVYWHHSGKGYFRTMGDACKAIPDLVNEVIANRQNCPWFVGFEVRA